MRPLTLQRVIPKQSYGTLKQQVRLVGIWQFRWHMGNGWSKWDNLTDAKFANRTKEDWIAEGYKEAFR